MVEQTQKPKQKREYKLLFGYLIMLIIIAFGAYTYITQPKISNPLSVYTYIQNNFNDSISNASYAPRLSVVSSEYIFPNKTVLTLQSDNKTYIYSFAIYGQSVQGAQSAAESYVLWNYLTNKPFPNYDTGLPTAASIPGIPMQYSLSNMSYQNIVLIASEVPSESSSTSNTIIAWLTKNLDNKQKYIFTQNASYGYLPTVYVVKTIANKTMICTAYVGMNFAQYNATTSTSVFLGQNVRNLTFGTTVPTPSSMNTNLNTLNACIKIVNRWAGN